MDNIVETYQIYAEDEAAESGFAESDVTVAFTQTFKQSCEH